MTWRSPFSLGRLYLVATPRAGQAEEDFVARVAAALDGGVDTLQLRCKADYPAYGEARAVLRLAGRLREMAHDRGVPLLINDRVDLAAAAGADGVHLGQEDLPLAWARALAPGLGVGLSTHHPAQAAAAVAQRPAYFAVGPVYATPTKPGRMAAGLDYVQHVAQTHPEARTGVPWYAIGGLDLTTVDRVVEAGARRIAVVRAVLDDPDPAEAANRLRACLPTTPLEAPACH
ncbi:thiamine phosphate synthase [Deinococcus hohokamensis]|uniref:Thiamine-phosphate synthase n=1 Tax=Deinococcus hohokamensis TaxID=309883 RepID=A0ABV9I9M4_9DEIO